MNLTKMMTTKEWRSASPRDRRRSVRDDDDDADGIIVEAVDDAGPNVELDEIDVELDDGTVLILGEELIDGVSVGNIVTVGPTLPTGMTLLEGRFDDAGPMLLPLVEGTLSDDKGNMIDINGL